MSVFLILYAAGFLGFAISALKLPPAQRTKGKIVELLLLYQLVFSLGITSFVAFLGLTFLERYSASYLAWPASPFEQELANVNLAYGVLGIMCIWFRKSFWGAVITGFAIWILTDGIHHVYEAFVHKNFSEGNTGFLMYTDLLVPIFLLILFYFYYKWNLPQEQRRAKFIADSIDYHPNEGRHDG